MPAEEPKPLTRTPVPVSSLNSSAACSAIGRQVVEPATVIDSVDVPELHDVRASMVERDRAAVMNSRDALNGRAQCAPPEQRCAPKGWGAAPGQA